jgi:hypothetical protein
MWDVVDSGWIPPPAGALRLAVIHRFRALTPGRYSLGSASIRIS